MNFLMNAASESAAKPLPAAFVLDQLSHLTFRNVEIGRRHPAAVYRMAIRNIVESFDDALAAHDAVVSGGEEALHSPGLEKALIKALDHLLDAVAEHFDDAKCCLQLILEALPEKQVKKHLGEYDNSIRTVRAFCTTQVNEMKHRQGRVQLIRAEFANSTLWGYFIQGVGRGGEIGPNPRVHKTNTAYSFGRAFRTLAMAVLFTSKALAAAVCRTPTYRLANGRDGFGPLLTLVVRLSAMPRIVFWDETEICPDFRIGAEAIEVRVPASRRWKSPPQGSRIKFAFAWKPHLELIAFRTWATTCRRIDRLVTGWPHAGNGPDGADTPADQSRQLGRRR